MKRKIVAIVASILVFSGAGVYAAQNSSASVKSVPAATAVTVKSTKANAAIPVKANTAVNTAAKTAAAVKGKTSATSCPTAKAVTVVQKSASSCSGTQKAVPSAVSSQKSSCSSAAAQAVSQAAKSCTQGSNCTNVQILCPALTGSGQCSGSNCYQNILCYLTGKGCGQSSAPVSSAPATSSKPSVASKPPVTSSAPASSAPAASGSYSSFQNQVVQLVNQERTSRGLKALAVDSALTKTATLKSQDMAKLGYFDHNSPTYGSPFDMMKQFGITYRAAGENIAYGQTSPAQVMQGWMNSEGHRANILSTSYTKIGVGIAQNAAGRYYWTQQFIG